jgi:signal peptidase
MMRILKKVLGWLGGLVLGILVLIVAAIFLGNLNGWQFAAILSGSMEPNYNVGGMVVIQPVNPETLKVGDPISFNLPGFTTPICHRIIAIRYKNGDKYFQTQGDAVEEPDNILSPASSVNGKVILHLPYVGRLIEVKDKANVPVSILGKSLPVAIWIILSMGIIFILLMLKDNWSDITRPHEKSWRDRLKMRNAVLEKRRRIFGLH